LNGGGAVPRSTLYGDIVEVLNVRSSSVCIKVSSSGPGSSTRSLGGCSAPMGTAKYGKGWTSQAVILLDYLIYTNSLSINRQRHLTHLSIVTHPFSTPISPKYPGSIVVRSNTPQLTSPSSGPSPPHSSPSSSPSSVPLSSSFPLPTSLAQPPPPASS